MHQTTKWEFVKDTIRYWLCRHKHTTVRTVKGGSEGKGMKVIARYKYCLDCKNGIESLPPNPKKDI